VQRKLLDFRLTRFAIVGLANTAAGLSIIFACKAVLGANDVVSNLAGYSFAVLLGFILNKRWTFDHNGEAAVTFARYLLVLVLAYAANLFTTLVAIDILHLNSYLAHAAGIVPYTLAGYTGARWFVFNQRLHGDSAPVRPGC
jgi:putative flippase GtrA